MALSLPSRPFKAQTSPLGRASRSKDREARPQTARGRAGLLGELRDPRLEQVKVALPSGVVRRQGGQANHDRAAASQRFQRLRDIFKFAEAEPNPPEGHGKIALPAGAGI